MVNFSVFSATCETMAPLVMAFFIAFGAMASARVGSCDGAVARWWLGCQHSSLVLETYLIKDTYQN